VLQNPVLTSHLDLYLLASEALADTCTLVTAGDDTVPMNRMEGPYEAYRGDYELKANGPLTICAGACDLLGNASDTCRTFSATRIVAAAGGTMRSADGTLSLSLDSGTLERNAFVIIFEDIAAGGAAQARLAGANAAEQTNPWESKAQSGAGLTPAYTISPLGMKLMESAELRFRLDKIRVRGNSSPAICTWDGAAWKELGTHWDGSRGELVAFVTSFGTYQVRESTSGVVSSPDARGKVYGPYPNPFASKTTIIFDVPAPATVDVSIYDAKGRLVRTLLTDSRVSAPRCIVEWDGLTGEHTRAPAGVYLWRVRIGGKTITRRAVFVG
jgi:hypothetical protein